MIAWAQIWVILLLRLETLFQKKQVTHVHVHLLRNTPHTHHTHTFIYARVYTCTYCGCKGHLTKFCYDRLNISNFANKNVWVSNVTDPREPQKIWVPKFSPLFFYVGIGSQKTWEIWCLGCDAIGAWWTNQLMHHYQGV